MTARINLSVLLIVLIALLLTSGVFFILLNSGVILLSQKIGESDKIDSDRPLGEDVFSSPFNPVLKEPPGHFSLTPPVEEKYFKLISSNSEATQRLIFFLPAESEIKAVFDGKVTKVLLNNRPANENVPFSEIVLTRNDGEYWAAYLLVGEVLVIEGDSVSAGSVLAKTSGDFGSGYVGGGNLAFWVHDISNEMLKLSKNVFKLN